MSIITTVTIRCDLCTATDTQTGPTAMGAWMACAVLGWTRGNMQHIGAHAGWRHYYPRCSALPNLAERIRTRRRAAAQQGENE